MRTGKETGVAETELAKRRQWKMGSKAGVGVRGRSSNLCRVSQAFVRALAFTQLNFVKNSPKSNPPSPPPPCFEPKTSFPGFCLAQEARDLSQGSGLFSPGRVWKDEFADQNVAACGGWRKRKMPVCESSTYCREVRGERRRTEQRLKRKGVGR